MSTENDIRWDGLGIDTVLNLAFLTQDLKKSEGELPEHLFDRKHSALKIFHNPFATGPIKGN